MRIHHILLAAALILSTSVAANAGPTRGLVEPAPTYASTQGSIQTLGPDGTVQTDPASATAQQPLESLALQPAAPAQTGQGVNINGTHQLDNAQAQQQQQLQQQQAAQQQAAQQQAAAKQQAAMQRQQMMQQKKMMMQQQRMQQMKMQQMQAQRMQQMQMQRQMAARNMTLGQKIDYKVQAVKTGLKMKLVGALMGR